MQRTSNKETSVPKETKVKVETKVRGENIPPIEKKEPETATEDRRILFRKEGGGSFRLNGHIIKQGQVFKALPEDIPVAFRDIVVPVDKDFAFKEQEQKQTPKRVTQMQFKVVEGKDGMYDVVGPNNKPMNSRPLTKEVAEKLQKDLEK